MEYFPRAAMAYTYIDSAMIVIGWEQANISLIQFNCRSAMQINTRALVIFLVIINQLCCMREFPNITLGVNS